MAMVEIVRRLPVVEDLVAVLDRRKAGSRNVGDEEDKEGDIDSGVLGLLRFGWRSSKNC
jgi:hypothetical protein